ncbi:MAG: NAD regulator [Alphaproteobacteria bacterium]|nr:NAD regulator [Alphaproteobacteria bacterium]
MGLNAAIVAVAEETPLVLTVRRPELPVTGAAGATPALDDPSAEQGSVEGLPFGPFDPILHRTLEIGLRSWVEEQTELQLGYVEQLYTFGDRGRYAVTEGGPRVVSVGYLALTRGPSADGAPGRRWSSWYHHFPWEDWRAGRPALIDAEIVPLLQGWTQASRTFTQRRRRWERARLCFGLEDLAWDEEKVLERYELLYEAGLVAESVRDQRLRHGGPEASELFTAPERPLGAPMQFDHRRILATAIGRLRGKLKYRPVVFELMAETFTLLELQRTAEAIAGVRVHKQNFRRIVEREGLVEGTGDVTTRTGGRPAELFRFRREVVSERPAAGLRVSPAGLGRRPG